MAISANYQLVRGVRGALVKGVSTLSMLPFMVLVWSAAEANTSTVDPSAPLEILKTARQTAAGSNLNVASATTGGANVMNITLIIFGVIGVVLAGGSSLKLYKNVQDGDNARGSNSAYVIAIVLSALLTILAVIVGVISNFATGSGAT